MVAVQNAETAHGTVICSLSPKNRATRLLQNSRGINGDRDKSKRGCSPILVTPELWEILLPQAGLRPKAKNDGLPAFATKGENLQSGRFVFGTKHKLKDRLQL